MNKKSTEKTEKYEMDEYTLKEKGHIIITKEHSILWDGRCWNLMFRPEYREDKKGNLFLSTDNIQYYPNKKMLLKDMLNDISYHHAKKHKSDLKNLLVIMEDSLRELDRIADRLIGNPEQLEKKPTIKLPF